MPWVSAHVARSDAVALFNLPASTAIRRPAPRAATPCTAGDAAPVRTSERDRQNKMRQRSSRAQTAPMKSTVSFRLPCATLVSESQRRQVLE